MPTLRCNPCCEPRRAPHSARPQHPHAAPVAPGAPAAAKTRRPPRAAPVLRAAGRPTVHARSTRAGGAAHGSQPRTRQSSSAPSAPRGTPRHPRNANGNRMRNTIANETRIHATIVCSPTYNETPSHLVAKEAMRQRKPTNLHATLRRYHAPIVDTPAGMSGRWVSAFMPEAQALHLDLGCGKGTFLAEVARAHPNILFVGIDHNEVCIARAAQKVVEQKLRNVRLACADAADLETIFAENELDLIYLNFNSPFPKKKHAEKRLTHLTHLQRYRRLLHEGGIIDMRTDNLLYWEFSLAELEIAGYTIQVRTDDLHRDATEFGATLPSEYDARTTARGARVRSLRAQPGPEPSSYRQTCKLGLSEYLPEDIENFREIPYGMEDTVANMRNRRANERERVKREEIRKKKERS